MTDPAPTASIYRRRRAAAGLVVLAVTGVIALAIVIFGGGGAAAGGAGTAGGPAGVVPADALAYVRVAVARDDPAVARALAVARRLPDFPLLAAAAASRVGAILGAGRPANLATDVSSWLGGGAAVALLNTTTSTAGTLIVVAVRDESRARSFLRSAGAAAHGSYRGRSLEAFGGGTELAFIGSYLVIGQDASVRAAIDVAAGATPSLAASAPYRRAVAGEGTGQVLTAYASAAGVRRVLADQGGVLGAIGTLLDQPALQGVAISLTPTDRGAQVRIHGVLDAALQQVGANRAADSAFTPTLQAVMPATASLVLDVHGLDKVAPQVLNAGSADGIAGGIGPLLSRLGSALRAEGVNVSDLVSIFRGEAAVGIVGGGQSPRLVVVARTSNEARIRSELAQLQAPLAQLFSTPGRDQSSEPVFNDRQVGGVTAHQLQLATGFQLDYAVFGGLVVISTSLDGIGDVARRSHPLSRDPSFGAVVGARPTHVTSLVFARLGALLGAGTRAGLAAGSLGARLLPDLEHITAAGLTSTRGASDATTQIVLQITR